MSKRTPIVVFMLIALAFRSLVPDGFMIAAANAGDGSFEIVICTSTGQKTMHVAADGTTPAEQQGEPDLCPFAFSSVGDVATGEPDLAGTVAYASLTYKLAAALYAETPKPGATSARGPPNLLI
ncbi:hypothetical protein W911_13355 [Hyphomicrobium nitrativorans NL23]|uniref:DUF2946 domain-containing protein n=1 Tax=Hyphomicrobium nitrativorans NL23 TaxID=1029756 RepID=V5SGL1_9HYPH|nr:hypothetical protein [Hyphomicrobium nitrativorans]AHB49175.1 hypothetical protein W911_13355 [Hyphomicrobium nitrativorans NL23]